MRKPLSVLIAGLLCLIFLCACSQKSDETKTTGIYESTSSASSQTTLADRTQTTGDGLSSETASAPAASDAGTEAQTNSGTLPSTPAEIVRFINDAANRVKQTKPGYTFSSRAGTDKKNVVVSDNVPFHSFIASFAASAINSAKKDNITVAKGASHDDFPVKGQPWASKIDETALISATLNQAGDYYEIKLKFKDEKLASLPAKNNSTNHGKAFSLLLDEDFRKEFGGFNTKFMGIDIRVDNQKFEPTYSGSTIKCKTDKAGNMVSAVYYLNTSSDVEMLVTVNGKETLIKIKLAYSMTETYTIG